MACNRRATKCGTSLCGPWRVALAVLICLGLIFFWLTMAQPRQPEQPTRVVEPALATPSAQIAEPDPAQRLARGLNLYATHCAACHGDTGAGDGSAAYLLYPKARNFGEGTFRITSTRSGLPTDQDLLRTLRQGMPGSAMPPWDHLPQRDLEDLVLAVRHLSIEGKADQIQQVSRNMPRERALEVANRLLATTEPVEIPAHPGKDRIDLPRGQELYTATCLQCHDADGKGALRRDLKDTSDIPIFARDFTRGIFKGGSDDAEIARRITLGIPGTPMPATELAPEDLWSLVAYVKQFIDPEAQARMDARQKTLRVARVNRPVSENPHDPAWQNASSTFFAVMPLWWRDERIEGVNVAAIHDGKNLAIYMRWTDETVDDAPLTTELFTDGVAVQLSSASNPPFFAMGTSDGPVSIWHWKAVWERDVEGKAPTLTDVYPHRDTTFNDAAPHDPVFQSGTAAGNPLSQTDHRSGVENLHARGFGTLTTLPRPSQIVRSNAKRVGDEWRVVFVHPLGDVPEGQVALRAGETVSVAFAVWDGQARDRDGQKSVTIWHRLAIDR